MKIQRTIPIIALSMTLLPCMPSLGQVTRDQVFEGVIAPGISDPSLTSPVTGGQPQVTLTSSKDGSNLVGEVGLKFPGDWIWSLRLQAPVENGQEEVELANLEGLGGGAVATMGFTKVFFQVANPEGILKVCDDFNRTRPARTPINIPEGRCTLTQLQRSQNPEEPVLARRVTRQASVDFCDEINKRGLQGRFLLQKDLDFVGNPPAGFEDCNAFIQRKREEAAVRSPVSESARALVAELDQKIQDSLQAACREHNETLPEGWIDTSVSCALSDLEQRPGGRALREKALKEIGLSSPKFLSIKVSASNKNFKFAKDVTVDGVPTIEEAKESKDSYSGTASFGVLNRGFYYGANAIFERLYKGAPVSQICRPIPNRPGDTCSNLALKGPQRADQDIYQVELRRFFSDHLGINAKVSYEAQEKVEGYQLLVYLLKSDDKGLNGGLDFGYRSDTNDFTVRAFIGMSLKIVPASAF